MHGAIFVPTVQDTKWLLDMLPGHSPAELPVAGKRIIDYDIEYARKLDFDMFEVIDWAYSKRLETSVVDLTSMNAPVFYQHWTGEIPRGLNDLASQSTPLTQHIEDGTAVLWGLMVTFNFEPHAGFLPIPDEELVNTPSGVYRYLNGKWCRRKLPSMIVKTPKDWLDVNRAVLHSPGLFTLPGYSAEKDVHLGRNVVLEHGTEVKPPVVLQDNCWCARNVTLDGDVVVGEGSFISEGAHLTRTVVGDDTYVGLGLDLTDKIVIGHRIIDANTGVYTDIEEPGLARGLGGGFGWISKIFAFLLGNSRGRVK